MSLHDGSFYWNKASKRVEACKRAPIALARRATEPSELDVAAFVARKGAERALRERDLELLVDNLQPRD